MSMVGRNVKHRRTKKIGVIVGYHGNDYFFVVVGSQKYLWKREIFDVIA